MFSIPSRMALVVFVCLFGTSYGQHLVKLQEEDFSDAVKLTIYQAPGTNLARVFEKWGVTFNDAIGARPTAQILPVEPPICISCWPPPIYCLFNQNPELSSPDSSAPLVIDFRIPVRRVGFVLHAGGAKTFTVRAFNAKGETVGSFQEAFDTGTFSTFFGVEESAGPWGIYKVVIDYGTGPGSVETLETLLFEYAQRDFEFVSYLPQIGDGPVFMQGAVTGLQTAVIVANPTPREANALCWFIDRRAESLMVNIGGYKQTGTSFSIPAFSSHTIQTDGNTFPVASGYVKVMSKTPVDVMAIYRGNGSDGPILEAGIAPATPQISGVAPIDTVPQAGFDNAIALVNVGDQRAEISLSLRDSTGQSAGYKSLRMWPGEQLAQFLWELFPEWYERELHGSLSIYSNQPLLIEAIRTRDGLPVASLPVASEGR